MITITKMANGYAVQISVNQPHIFHTMLEVLEFIENEFHGDFDKVEIIFKKHSSGDPQ